MLAIRIPQEIEQRLEALAKKTGRTKTYYARKAIVELLEDMEDTYLAIDRLENPGKRWSQKDVRSELGLDN
jgi:RHH-type rel operon transcriptional repressor/antitoxin RelB